MTELSIIIPTCNRGDMLCACLERLYVKSMLYSTLRSIYLTCFSIPEGWWGHHGRRRKIPLVPPSLRSRDQVAARAHAKNGKSQRDFRISICHEHIFKAELTQV